MLTIIFEERCVRAIHARDLLCHAYMHAALEPTTDTMYGAFHHQSVV